jgi:hypothetical protein
VLREGGEGSGRHNEGEKNERYPRAILSLGNSRSEQGGRPPNRTIANEAGTWCDGVTTIVQGNVLAAHRFSRRWMRRSLSPMSVCANLEMTA